MKIEKGMMLVTILMLTFLLVMLTTSMIFISSQNLNVTGLAEKKAKALQAAEAGVDYAFYRLNNDSTWGTGVTLDTPQENLGSNQGFTIVFNPSASHHSKNNLMNKDPNGSTPGYSAEIISKGTYKGTEKILRVIFVREDEFLYPILSGGHFYSWNCGIDIKVNGKKASGDPGRVHSNSDMYFNGNTCATSQLLLDDGFVSTSGDITYYHWSGNNFKTKTKVSPVKLPDIDIPEIITNQLAITTCTTLPDNKYYIAGFFEYDPNAAVPYCVPHALPVSVLWDPNVNTSNYKIGIASVTDPNGCISFINNYGDFYYHPLPNDPPNAGYPIPLLPGLPNRNLYDKYSSIDFWEYDPINNIDPDLGITMKVSNPTDPSNVMIELYLNNDIYVPGTNGLFETGIFRVNSNHSTMPNTARYYAGRPEQMLDQSKTKFNLNNKNIYGGRVYMALPPTGKGTVITDETFDFVNAYDTEMVILSEKSVRLVYRYPKVNEGITFKGIIYAKNYLEIGVNENSIMTTGPRTFNFYGSMVTKNTTYTAEFPTLFQSQPLQYWWPWGYGTGVNGGGIMMDEQNKTNITHSIDGLDTIASLRGSNFKVRKMLCEVLK